MTKLRSIMGKMIDHPYNIGLLESISDTALEYLRDRAQIFDHLNNKTILTNLDALVTRGKGQVMKSLIDNCPKLKVIARCGVGINNIDVAYASQKQIKVVNTPGINADTVAEHTMTLVLTLQRRLVFLDQQVKAGNWSTRNTYHGDEIRGKTLGIIGFGNIGRKVADLAKAFKMNVIFWNRSDVSNEYDQVSLEHLLKHADVISLHLPINPDTYHFLNAARLGILKPNALIVNTGRGDLIDQKVLEEKLINNVIGGFAADVLAEQPPSTDSILLRHSNVILTPHAASLTQRTFDEICMLSVKNVCRLLEGKEIPDKFIVRL